MATSVLLTWIESSSRLSFSSTRRTITPKSQSTRIPSPVVGGAAGTSFAGATSCFGGGEATGGGAARFFPDFAWDFCFFRRPAIVSERWLFSFNLFFSHELQTSLRLYLAFGHISPLRWLHPLCPVHRQWLHSVDPHQMHFVLRGPGFFAFTFNPLGALSSLSIVLTRK